MTERTEPGPDVLDAMPTVERLVNLTEHAVTIDSLRVADGGSPVPSAVTLAPDGRVARVDDDRARLGEGWLNTADGLLELIRLRRSSRVTGLPPSVPGTRFVVSRVTALAARGRGDVVFPFGEIRDAQGRVTGAGGLAAFRPGLAVRDRWRDWRAGAAERRSRTPLAREWRTGVLFALATALLSAWLGLLPGAVDNALKNGWAGGGQVWTSWLTVAFFVSGLVILAWASRRWYRWQRVRADRGTAYVIEEQAIAWRHEEKQSVLAGLADGFASVLRVPGPEALGERWRWQADADGAPEWDRRTDELVRSFWAVHYNDDQETRNAVFVWAPWPVAMAFGARATARRRGLVLHVGQRPSSGAAGRHSELRVDLTHDFIRDPTALPAPGQELTASITVTIETLSQPRGHTARAGYPPVRLLLVRITEKPIGAIPVVLEKSPVITLHAPRCLTGSVLRPGTQTVDAAEWRLAGDDRSGQVPWDAFPAVADAIAGWIAGQAETHPGHVLLLATRMPQEIAVGAGIQAGQRGADWPDRLYPVHFSGGKLLVPSLDLGRDPIGPERD